MSNLKVFSLFKDKDYGSIFPQIKMLNIKPYNLFFEFATYDLMIPVLSRENFILNIFEETILKLLQFRTCTEKEMSEILCISVDLINFIVIRLKELGYIDDKRKLTDEGKDILSKFNEVSNTVTYQTAKIFVSKNTGDILPYVHIGAFEYEDSQYLENGELKIITGNAGRSKSYKGKCVKIKNSDFNIKDTLEQVELRRVLNTYNKMCKLNIDYKAIDLKKEHKIDSSRSEDVLVHFQAFIQDGNIDNAIVSEGFSKNIDFLSNELKNNYHNLFQNIRKDAIKLKDENAEDIKKYDEINRYKYPELNVLFQEVESMEGNLDERKEAYEKNKNRVTEYFYAIEWALHYQLKLYPISNGILNVLKSQYKRENTKTIGMMAEKIGIKYVKNNINLLSNLSSTKINEYYETFEPTLYVLLPLVIASASNNEESTLHNLVNRMPDFLDFLQLINSKSGNLRHDATETIEMKELEYILGKAQKIVKILLPDLSLESNKEKYKSVYTASQRRIKAEISLSEEMGYVFFNSLDINIQNEFIKISLDKNENELPKQYEYVLILSKILETYMYQIIKNINIMQKHSKQDALNRIKNRWKCEIPDSIKKVNDKFFNIVKMDGKGTLGAYTIVLMAYVDEELIDSLRNIDFADIIDEINNLRKHGNMVGLSIDLKELKLLRQKVISIMKVLGGYYG